MQKTGAENPAPGMGLCPFRHPSTAHWYLYFRQQTCLNDMRNPALMVRDMKKLLRTTAVLALCASLASAFTFAQGNSQKAKNKHNEQYEDDARYDQRDHDRGGPAVSIIFSSRDRDIIRDYFRGGYGNLPPGLAKRGGNLPPGLQKHLERNGTLPPGLQKRLSYFPADLDRRLSPLPPIYRRGTIGGAAVILDSRTWRIVDVVHDILTR